ncbi:MAG: hypothetical protein ACKO5F_02010 [Synechococcus sp.]
MFYISKAAVRAMPITRIKSSEPLHRREFHQRLKEWLCDSDEAVIGDPAVPGVSAWIYVRDAGRLFRLHADTPRHAIQSYLELVAREGDDMEWHVVNNKKGIPNAVGFGSEAKRVKSLYMYLCA